MKFTSGEAIMFLLVGFVFGLSLMALIQWLGEEWGEIDLFIEKRREARKRRREPHNCENCYNKILCQWQLAWWKKLLVKAKGDCLNWDAVPPERKDEK